MNPPRRPVKLKSISGIISRQLESLATPATGSLIEVEFDMFGTPLRAYDPTTHKWVKLGLHIA